MEGGDKREFNDNGLEGTRCTVVVTFENNDGTNEVIEATADLMLELLNITVLTIAGDELLLGVMPKETLVP